MTMHRTCSLAMALTLLACSDSKKLTEPLDEPSLKAIPLAPIGRGMFNPAVKRIEGITAMASSGPAPHNPRSQAGDRIVCFSGSDDGDQDPDPAVDLTYGGTCHRFEPTRDGAELNTTQGDPDGNYAGLYAIPVRIRGKRLGDVIEMRFSYAGGTSSGGIPRWSVAIDENGNGRFDHDPFDANSEQYAFTDAHTHCNDGDSNVGTLDGEDDGTCTWFYKAESHLNWDAFAGAHPTWKIAQRHSDGSGGFIPAFVINDQPAHYVIWGLDVR